MDLWSSPDGKISKEIIHKGSFGAKPSETCECIIFIDNVQGNVDVDQYNNTPLVIGDVDTQFGRLLSESLLTMAPDEIANLEFNIDPKISCTVHLKSFEVKKLIYDWTAKEKYDLALMHKEKGVLLFNNSYSEASHRFSKALKILSSIPIAVDEPPTEVDGVLISDIEKLRSNLYNNLSSCYLRVKKFEEVIQLCLKVEKDNEKALYKLGVAYYEEKQYDSARKCLTSLLENYPNNKLAMDKLKQVNAKLEEEDRKSKDLAKRMFAAI